MKVLGKNLQTIEVCYFLSLLFNIKAHKDATKEPAKKEPTIEKPETKSPPVAAVTPFSSMDIYKLSESNCRF